MLDKTKKNYLSTADTKVDSSSGDRNEKARGAYESEELAKFDALAEEWWNPTSKFKSVLAFNAVRVDVIIQGICQHFQRDAAKPNALKGIRILDIGCGAGLICEPLAELGAEVTGIDGSEMNIKVATQHAKSSGLSISYQHALAEELDNSQLFDVVLNTEVIEHVIDQDALVETCANLVAEKGMLVMATLDRTFKSFVVAIIGAEYVLRMLPRGTHNWRFFVKPREMEQKLAQHHFKLFIRRGFAFNPLTRKWRVETKPNVNYMQMFCR
ncbi:bifunctional 3-demethylubiquinol 3-O-methyltransferase/2-polyprenyl-6-hydroxyphenol methylase [Aliidiomarina iranensis]|uniref:Ubiquinone biosynthesis O-methyltransferase n=1 Tax=Aliidiomarina iranensis TaxID=1434071 RepID=A0A432VZT4_9GAMM|nr:bifunctional 2-polyprenyl-6-hydroxyphenol methylase/3-demethylubiquinol 3-O-methyltransferase UbiG [Aliidiomarina iranensis]RUO22261.1 bifunctional 3-demethylubiquinol 3-O-methyltransferase/2-polyprenyl-6-hydroxyphenol methylase [Aliidiomarina iranensis]